MDERALQQAFTQRLHARLVEQHVFDGLSEKEIHGFAGVAVALFRLPQSCRGRAVSVG